MKITTEDFTDLTLAISDTYGDNVRGDDVVVEHGGGNGGDGHGG